MLKMVTQLLRETAPYIRLYIRHLKVTYLNIMWSISNTQYLVAFENESLSPDNYKKELNSVRNRFSS